MLSRVDVAFYQKRDQHFVAQCWQYATVKLPKCWSNFRRMYAVKNKGEEGKIVSSTDYTLLIWEKILKFVLLLLFAEIAGMELFLR